MGNETPFYISTEEQPQLSGFHKATAQLFIYQMKPGSQRIGTQVEITALAVGIDFESKTGRVDIQDILNASANQCIHQFIKER